MLGELGKYFRAGAGGRGGSPHHYATTRHLYLSTSPLQAAAVLPKNKGIMLFLAAATAKKKIQTDLSTGTGGRGGSPHHYATTRHLYLSTSPLQAAAVLPKISFGGIPNSNSIDILITWLLLSRWQGNKPHRNSPEPLSGTFQDLPEPTFRNLPEPASGTSTCTRRNSQEPSGTFRNLPPDPAPATRGFSFSGSHSQAGPDFCSSAAP